MPDLNSVPASPHSLAASRRHSSRQMPPPPSTTTTTATTTATAAAAAATASNPSSLNILPSNQNTVNNGPPSAGHSPRLAATHPPLNQPTGAAIAGSDVGVGSGPGPLRHPRPLTASQLHMQLEKEQEALVNRLTRELSILRAAHNASVASNTSSTSAGTSTHEPVSDVSLLSGSGFSIPASRRHTRTSSSTSMSHVAQAGSSYDPRMHAPRAPQAIPLSRQDSAASRHSQGASPAMSFSLDPSSYFHQQRIPVPTSIPGSSTSPAAGTANFPDQMSPGLVPATLRYEETAFHRGELETAKKENDSLKKRIRELEKQVKERKETEATRTRSESVSTTASISAIPAGGSSIAPPRDASHSVSSRPDRDPAMASQSNLSFAGNIAVGVSDEEVQVGESASSSRPNPAP